MANLLKVIFGIIAAVSFIAACIGYEHQIFMTFLSLIVLTSLYEPAKEKEHGKQ